MIKEHELTNTWWIIFGRADATLTCSSRVHLTNGALFTRNVLITNIHTYNFNFQIWPRYCHDEPGYLSQRSFIVLQHLFTKYNQIVLNQHTQRQSYSPHILTQASTHVGGDREELGQGWNGTVETRCSSMTHRIASCCLLN